MCPVKNEEYLEIEKKFGEGNALAIWNINGHESPSIENAKKLLDSKILNIFHHMDTSLDKKGMLSGPLGEGLSKEGIAEAEALAQSIEVQKLKTIYCSDAPRAKQTCEIFKKANPELKIVIDKGLRTWDRGKFIGGLEKDFPTKFYVNRPDIKVPGGESFDDYFKTFTDTIQKYRNLSDSEAILSHADGIKTLKSMENSYGEFDPKVYTHDDTTSAAEKQWQNIRQFDNGGEVKEVEEEESKEPEVDLNNTHKLIQSLIDNNIIDMICPTA